MSGNDHEADTRRPEAHPPRRRPLLDWLADFAFGRLDDGPGKFVLRLLAFVWAMVFLGLASLLAPAAVHVLAGEYRQALTVLGVGLFLAGAATATGSMLGFLFGVPKVAKDHPHDDDADGEKEPAYVPNTNLETISDWLTKIIVGVGLVEIRQVIAWVDQIGQVVGQAMGPAPAMRVIATSLLIHDLFMGFFQGFLVAYIYLPKVFAASRSKP